MLRGEQVKESLDVSGDLALGRSILSDKFIDRGDWIIGRLEKLPLGALHLHLAERLALCKDLALDSHTEDLLAEHPLTQYLLIEVR